MSIQRPICIYPVGTNWRLASVIPLQATAGTLRLASSVDRVRIHLMLKVVLITTHYAACRLWQPLSMNTGKASPCHH